MALRRSSFDRGSGSGTGLYGGVPSRLYISCPFLCKRSFWLSDCLPFETHFAHEPRHVGVYGNLDPDHKQNASSKTSSARAACGYDTLCNCRGTLREVVVSFPLVRDGQEAIAMFCRLID